MALPARINKPLAQAEAIEGYLHTRSAPFELFLQEQLASVGHTPQKSSKCRHLEMEAHFHHIHISEIA